MERELKPAHEVIVELIEQHCANIQTFESAAEKQRSDPLLDHFQDITRNQKIGGLDALLEALTRMIIPPDKLPAVVEALKRLTYSHCIITDAIETLEQRQAASSAVVTA